MTTAVSRQNRTLSDTLIPYSGLWVDIATIIVGSLIIAAFAQLKFSLPWTPVPITGQTFAVLLVAATVGSKRGGLAAVLYLFEGSAGLPFWAGGASGTVWASPQVATSLVLYRQLSLSDTWPSAGGTVGPGY